MGTTEMMGKGKPRLDLKAIGSRIRWARYAANFTNGEEFTRRLKIGHSSLWRYETGRMLPRPDVLLGVKRLTGVSTDWLLTGKGRGPKVSFEEATGYAELAQAS